MISILMPYWNRQAAADDALAQFAKTYPDLNAEIIVIDDGNAVPFVAPDVGLEIVVLRLPEKSDPKPQSKVWNIAVKYATHDVILFNCIEIIHDQPVIPAMRKELRKLGPDGYVLAAAYCPDARQWHCHSTVRVPDCPDGVGIGFCGMLRKSLFYRAGGFDEDYMDGAGYEDRDFIRRMDRAGAKFKVCDDLVVKHPKRGASINWPTEGFERNKELFYRKWPC